MDEKEHNKDKCYTTDSNVSTMSKLAWPTDPRSHPIPAGRTQVSALVAQTNGWLQHVLLLGEKSSLQVRSILLILGSISGQ